MSFKPEVKLCTFIGPKKDQVGHLFNNELKAHGAISVAFYKKAFGNIEGINPVDYKWGWTPAFPIVVRPHDIRYADETRDQMYLDLGEMIELDKIEKKIVNSRGELISKEKQDTLLGVEIPDAQVSWVIGEVGKLLKRDNYYTNADMKLIIGMAPSLLDKCFGYSTFPTFVANKDGNGYSKLVLPPVTIRKNLGVSTEEKDTIKKFESHRMSESLIWPRLAKLKTRIQTHGFISLKYMMEVLDRDGTDDDACFTWTNIDESWIVEVESPQKGVRYFSFKIPEKSAFSYTAGMPWYPRVWFMTENAALSLRGVFKDLIAETGCITVADFKLAIGYQTEAEDHNWGWFWTGCFGYSARSMANVRPGASPMVEVKAGGPMKLGTYAKRVTDADIVKYNEYRNAQVDEKRKEFGLKPLWPAINNAVGFEEMDMDMRYNPMPYLKTKPQGLKPFYAITDNSVERLGSIISWMADEMTGMHINAVIEKGLMPEQVRGAGKSLYAAKAAVEEIGYKAELADLPKDVGELAINLDRSDTALFIARDAMDLEDGEEPYKNLLKGASDENATVIRNYVSALKLAFELAGPALDAIEEEEGDEDDDN